jgi:hypothetical protein
MTTTHRYTGNQPVGDEPAAVTEPALDPSTPVAPRWRRGVARAIDLAVVLVVFSLFLTPVIAVYSGGGSPSVFLRASAWVYMAVFVALALSLVRGRNRQRRYLTVGMNIMDLRPVKMGKVTRFVRDQHLHEGDGERHGLAMVAVALPLIVLGVAFFVFELIAYT